MYIIFLYTIQQKTAQIVLIIITKILVIINQK